MPNKKKKTSKSPRATVSNAQLAKQVKVLGTWVQILKGHANMGGWTLSMAKGKYKPDPTGGPPGGM
ncbi:MAG TPA: hypothetical protein VNM36_10325 [Gemmatimonadaceae bacterium]|nr:hypothetical protein [Gemmatimonadaceae bacterium]